MLFRSSPERGGLNSHHAQRSRLRGMPHCSQKLLHVQGCLLFSNLIRLRSSRPSSNLIHRRFRPRGVRHRPQKLLHVQGCLFPLPSSLLSPNALSPPLHHRRPSYLDPNRQPRAFSQSNNGRPSKVFMWPWITSRWKPATALKHDGSRWTWVLFAGRVTTGEWGEYLLPLAVYRQDIKSSLCSHLVGPWVKQSLLQMSLVGPISRVSCMSNSLLGRGFLKVFPMRG